MAESAHVPELAVQSTYVFDTPRHYALVRVTHWIFTASFFGLLVSGWAIILSHPHFYWGEAGGIGSHSILDLPLPTMLGGPSGWGRSLHFQSAWFGVLTGLVYLVSGILTQHFSNEMLPARGDLSWRSLRDGVGDHLRLKRPVDDGSYNLVQRLSYLCVVFVLFPLTILTGFAKSPAITSVVPSLVPVSGLPPKREAYERLLAGGFKDWRLTVDGMVARPATFTLEELKGMPARSQITHQACEEGWSFICQWTGVPLSNVLNLVGVSAQAKYVVVYAFDDVWDSLDMPDAHHPQTFLTYGMNGPDLNADHGAPLRLRVARQLGYKSVKFLSRITVTDSLKHVGDGKGSIQPAFGYSWYAGI